MNKMRIYQSVLIISKQTNGGEEKALFYGRNQTNEYRWNEN